MNGVYAAVIGMIGRQTTLENRLKASPQIIIIALYIYFQKGGALVTEERLEMNDGDFQTTFNLSPGDYQLMVDRFELLYFGFPPTFSHSSPVQRRVIVLFIIYLLFMSTINGICNSPRLLLCTGYCNDFSLLSCEIETYINRIIHGLGTTQSYSSLDDVNEELENESTVFKKHQKM